MSKPNDYDTYIIPPNFIEGGTFFGGLLKLRNTAEALVNLMQMVLAKEKLNLFMKGDETDMDDIYEQFGVDYDLKSLLLYRDVDEEGHFSIRWGEQKIA